MFGTVGFEIIVFGIINLEVELPNYLKQMCQSKKKKDPLKLNNLMKIQKCYCKCNFNNNN